MTTFDDRERAFEAKFARDSELEFKVIARRNRLLGEWAATRLGLTPEETEAYARGVVQADFEEPGDGDVLRKLSGDFAGADVDIDEAAIRQALSDCEAEARRTLIEGV